MKKVFKSVIFSLLALGIIIVAMGEDDGHDPKPIGTNPEIVIIQSL